MVAVFFDIHCGHGHEDSDGGRFYLRDWPADGRACECVHADDIRFVVRDEDEVHCVAWGDAPILKRGVSVAFLGLLIMFLVEIPCLSHGPVSFYLYRCVT